MDSGKHFLLTQDGSEKTISKIGTFRPKFRNQVSGIATPKLRVLASKTDLTALHFTPDCLSQKENGFYTPFTRKLAGYAQQPYYTRRLKHLDNPDNPHTFSERSAQQGKSMSTSAQHSNPIFEFSERLFLEKQMDSYFYDKSLTNQNSLKPLPRGVKKTCYNYPCKHLKHFTFDEREKTRTTMCAIMATPAEDLTMSKAYYDKQLAGERKEL